MEIFVKWWFFVIFMGQFSAVILQISKGAHWTILLGASIAATLTGIAWFNL